MQIFTRTVNETQRLAILLRSLGFSAIPLHGQLSQSARLGALGKFRARSRDILVATDVAARGLDIPSVDVVVNFDLPEDSKTYIHRVGRTARAGKSGHAISMVTQYDVEIWRRCIPAYTFLLCIKFRVTTHVLGVFTLHHSENFLRKAIADCGEHHQRGSKLRWGRNWGNTSLTRRRSVS